MVSFRLCANLDVDWVMLLLLRSLSLDGSYFDVDRGVGTAQVGPVGVACQSVHLLE
jgi:hypothetical protein